MISLIDYEPHGPVFHGPDLDEFAAFDTATMAKELLREYLEFKSEVWQAAIYEATDGNMPPLEEIAQRAAEIVAPDGTRHLLWDHPPLGHGDQVDMDYCIATIDPPMK